MIGALAYIFWSLLLSFTFFYSLKLNGRLRCKAVYEIIGQDFMKHQNSHGNGVSTTQLKDIQRMMNLQRDYLEGRKDSDDDINY